MPSWHDTQTGTRMHAQRRSRGSINVKTKHLFKKGNYSDHVTPDEASSKCRSYPPFWKSLLEMSKTCLSPPKETYTRAHTRYTNTHISFLTPILIEGSFLSWQKVLSSMFCRGWKRMRCSWPGTLIESISVVWKYKTKANLMIRTKRNAFQNHAHDVFVWEPN